MSVIIGNLKRSNRIRRLPHDVHGRILQIELTDTGLTMLRQRRKRVHALEAELADGFSAGDQAVIRRWLVAIAHGDA